MNQKGSAFLYLLIILTIAGLISVKYSSFLKQITTPSQQIVSPQIPDKQSPQATDSAQINQAQLEKYLTVETALLGVSNNISLSFKDLDHNKEINIEPTRQWIPASTIKAFVVLEAFRQRDTGLINFDKEMTISADNVVPTELETDELPRLREGTKATIYQLVEAMIIQSDNTAYNTLLDILDRRNINLALRNVGITETVVGEKLNLDDNQFQKDLQIPGRQSNSTTAKDLTTLFDLLYNKQIAHSEEILSIFKRQRINNMIPVMLPKDVVIAHKTGEWSSIYHDSGVIFKSADPFVLSVLTNSGDPKIISAIAKVAYFQTADSIGPGNGQNKPVIEKTDSKKLSQLITLAKLPNNAEVLAAETSEKFPTITASDLGIQPKDLNPNTKEISGIGEAITTPDSIFYGIKKFFEERQLKNARTSSDLVTAHLNLAKSRLSEVKRLLGQGNIKGADSLLSESENHLALATDIAKNDPERNLLLIDIKHVNDLHFAVLLDKTKSIPAASKGQFIESVYNFYKQNQKNVDPVIKSSFIANSSQQKPAIGEITEIKNNEATLKFEDSTTKQIILRADTKVRNFQQTFYQDVSSIKKGDKIAVIGLTNRQSKIIPRFILKDIPKELPTKHTGTVIEINPDENTLKIIDKQGQIRLINILEQTIIRAKDTNVSLEGIKAGSQINVFGTTNQSQIASPVPGVSTSPSFSPTTSSPNPVSIPNSNNTKTTNQGVNANPPSTNNQSPAKPQIIEIQATSITVTKNSSGAQEKIEVKTQPKKEEPKKAPEPVKPPAAPAKPENKSLLKKK